MRKQTKLVAVLSAAALLAVGASMTSFAAGWTEENGTWVYYDGDDELVTNEWKKSGSNYYYLNDDGEMATETWVDDEYYVDETGKMVTNQWLKLVLDEAEIDDPNGDGEGWFWFDSKGKKVTDTKKTINGKVYFFDGDGVMEYGWYEDDKENVYYLGDEDDGARKSGWLWLERPDVDNDEVNLCDDEDCTDCEEEGWYWFAKDGKVYKDAKQKKIDGKYYYFNEHGQMLYNWIIATENQPNRKDNDDLDTITKDIASMDYAFNVDKGWRVDGWLEVDGSYNMERENDQDWYFFDDGDVIYAEKSEKTNVANVLADYKFDNDQRYRAKIKKEGKWFCFDQDGRMKTGLQAITDDGETYETYYFDESGFMKTGKVSNVELDNGDTANFYFETSNSRKGQGVTGEESGYLYYKGMRLEADDDYEFYAIPAEDEEDAPTIYLVNKSGKIQKGNSTNGKRIDPEKIENKNYGIVDEIEGDADDYDVYVHTNKNGEVDWVKCATKTSELASATKIDLVKKELVTFADNYKEVDFGWED